MSGMIKVSRGVPFLHENENNKHKERMLKSAYLVLLQPWLETRFCFIQ